MSFVAKHSAYGAVSEQQTISSYSMSYRCALTLGVTMCEITGQTVSETIWRRQVRTSAICETIDQKPATTLKSNQWHPKCTKPINQPPCVFWRWMWTAPAVGRPARGQLLCAPHHWCCVWFQSGVHRWPVLCTFGDAVLKKATDTFKRKKKWDLNSCCLCYSEKDS